MQTLYPSELMKVMFHVKKITVKKKYKKYMYFTKKKKKKKKKEK